jgi:hypothetical protein
MMQTWVAEESASTLTTTDIVTDRLTFAAAALPPLARLRDKYIALASKMVDTITTAKREYEREMVKATIARRPHAAAPPPKRTTVAAEGRRLFRVVKSWSGKNQPPQEGVTFLPITEGELLVCVGEWDPSAEWMVMEREDGSECGTAPIKQSNGAIRMLEVEQPEPPMAAPVESDLEEDPEEEIEDSRADEEFVARTRADEDARIEADAAECGYDD